MSSWSLPREALTFLEDRVGFGQKHTVELGSGAGSAALARVCSGRLVSVEHDPLYIASYRGGVVVPAPIVNGWYSGRIVQDAIEGVEIEALVVDGPPGTIGRAGLLDNLSLFPPLVPMLIDDVHRPAERDLALEIARRRNQTLSLHLIPDGRAFATIGWAF